MDRVLIALLAVVFTSACGSERTGRSVAELLAVTESGHLLARRDAIHELTHAVAVTPREAEGLLAAARQDRRVRLRDAALTALTNDGPADARLLPACLAMLDDGRSRSLARPLCRRAGLAADDGRLPPGPTAPEARAAFRVRAEEAERLAGGVDPAESRRLAIEAEGLGKRGEAAALAALLDSPAFIAGGFAAGRLAAKAGPAALTKALALARSADLAKRDAGLGALCHLRHPGVQADLERLAKDADAGIAKCAKDALTGSLR